MITTDRVWGRKIGRMQRLGATENSRVCSTTVEVYTCDVLLYTVSEKDCTLCCRYKRLVDGSMDGNGLSPRYLPCHEGRPYWIFV